jgi:isopenicillin N synthase-like dioxygenase
MTKKLKGIPPDTIDGLRAAGLNVLPSDGPLIREALTAWANDGKTLTPSLLQAIVLRVHRRRSEMAHRCEIA